MTSRIGAAVGRASDAQESRDVLRGHFRLGFMDKDNLPG
jgi:hypothetical protein